VSKRHASIVTRSNSYNIVFVSSHLGHVRGGAELNDLKLGEEFRELGHQVRYVTQQDPNRSPREVEVDCHIVNTLYLYGRSYDLFEPAGKILRHLNEELFRWEVSRSAQAQLSEADLILTTGRPVLIKLKSMTDALVVHAVRGSVNKLYHRYLKQADGLIFWGGSESEYTDGRVLSCPRLTIDPAVNGSVFHPKCIDTNTKKVWQGDEDLLVAFVGRLEPVKSVRNLIDAVEEANCDIRLLVVGDGSQKRALEECADRVAPGSVSFPGYCDQETVAEILNTSDVFALASENENHPIALKEALACGTYCIAPNVGRVKSILPSDTGMVVSDNSVKTLSRAFDEVAEDNISADGRFDRAQPQNTWRNNAREIVDFYEQLLRDDAGEEPT